MQLRKLSIAITLLTALLAGAAKADNIAGDVSAISQKARVAIIVDDLGDNLPVAKRIMQLPGVLTVAVLPKTPQAKKIIALAKERGFERMMHLPMQAFSRPDLLGPGALMLDMSAQQLQHTFREDVASLQDIQGFNNHMGSLLSENEEAMRWVMQEAAKQQLFFVDSKTSQQSVAEKVAAQYGVPVTARDIFLDHQSEGISLVGQWQKAINIARKRGQVVVICHPYPGTVEFLERQLSSLPPDIELVPASTLTSASEPPKQKAAELSAAQ